jgi:hypothetical protein
MIAFAAAVPLLSGMPHSEKHENRRVIDNLEETWRNAALKGNSAAMDGLLADDYGITPSGVLQSAANPRSHPWNTSLKSIVLTTAKCAFGTTAGHLPRRRVGSERGSDFEGYRYTRRCAIQSSGAL